MTFDMFADEPVAVASPPPPPPVAAKPRQGHFTERQQAIVRQPGEVFMMQPTGQLNRWDYRGEVVIYDGGEAYPKGRGRWQTIDNLNHVAEFREERIELCRLIDRRLNTIGVNR